MASAHFSIDNEDRYFEDYIPGAIYEFGTIAVCEPEILEFARRFDPQPMHIDPAEAARGRYGGIIASGWHTVGLTMRLLVDHYLPRGASLASPGVDEVRWPHPVRPGDSLRIRLSVLESRPSRSKLDRGIIRTLVETFNQDGQLVLSLIAMSILRRRESASRSDSRP